jgi:hypothetical protein
MATSRSSLPRVVKICGRKVKVRVVPRLIDEDNSVLHGIFLPDVSAIGVSSNTGHNVNETFLHECIHAILHYSGQSAAIGENEEALVVALEHGLAELMPVLVKIWK